MTTLEKIELACIPAAGAGCWAAAGWLAAAGGGHLLLTTSALLLLQGLVRDVCLLIARRRQTAPTQRLRCMCIESTVGVAGVAAGLVLAGAGWDRPVNAPAWGWGVLAIGTLLLGFAVKDLVVQWAPWRIRRETDHVGIAFTWKK